MKVVIQRVNKAVLTCQDYKSEINKGLVVYFGVELEDLAEKTNILAKKIAKLRIFEDDNGKMNLSVLDIKGEVLAVSQFTLLADCSGGNRPSFSKAEKPERANKLYEKFVDDLKNCGIDVKKGVFGGDMNILQENIGPVTITYEV